MHAEIGDVVQKNTLLIEIDKRTPKNNVAQNEAALGAAKARLAIAKTQLDRANQLFKSQTLTQTDVEKADLEFANAQAQVVASQVALENAQITLEDCEVRAPVTGTILSKSVEPGTVIQSTTQAVSGGTTLMQMADLTNVQIRTRVDETDIGKVQPGMPTKVTVAAYPNQPFDGIVLKVEPQAVVEQNVTMFSVLIKIANREGLLKPGMNADVKIRIATRDSVAAVPTAALRAETDVLTSAKMLGIAEAQLRTQIWPDAKPPEQGAGTKTSITLPNGRQIALPDGVDAVAVKALMEKRRSGQELSEADRALMRKVFGRRLRRRTRRRRIRGRRRRTGRPRRRRWRPAGWRRCGRIPGRRRFGRLCGRRLPRRRVCRWRAAGAGNAPAPHRRGRPTTSSAATIGSSRCATTSPCRLPSRPDSRTSSTARSYQGCSPGTACCSCRARACSSSKSGSSNSSPRASPARRSSKARANSSAAGHRSNFPRASLRSL